MPFITLFNGKAPNDNSAGKRVEKGALDNARSSLASVLEERFGELPPNVMAAINAIDNPQRLRTLMRETVRVASLKAFLEKVASTEP